MQNDMSPYQATVTDHAEQANFMRTNTKSGARFAILDQRAVNPYQKHSRDGVTREI